ncbi:MAG: hypothetical protein ACNS62_22665 [Candidatus Cyclobacteriaceae bacterium M3_2C_046]
MVDSHGDTLALAILDGQVIGGRQEVPLEVDILTILIIQLIEFLTITGQEPLL